MLNPRGLRTYLGRSFSREAFVVAGGDGVSAARKLADKDTVWGFLVAVERRRQSGAFHADDIVAPVSMRTVAGPEESGPSRRSLLPTRIHRSAPTLEG